MKRPRIIVTIAAATSLAAVAGCGIGQPMAVIPEPESQLVQKPGLFTDDNGEWVIYRKK
jgi:hypothetical protein